MNPDHVYVGVSGGVDSMCLLHMLSAQHKHVTAIYVDHNLQAESKSWKHFIESECITNYPNVTFVFEEVNIEGSTGVEEKARKQRYAAFKKHTDRIYTAHHGDDNIETLFLKLLRGAGVFGLQCMSRNTTVYGVDVVRPLLDYSKADLHAYAKEHSIEFVDDPSNMSSVYNRNFIRNELLPTMYSHFSRKTVCSGFTKSIAALQSASACLTDLAEIDYDTCHDDIDMLRKLPEHRVTNLLSYIVRENHGSCSHKQYAEFVRQLRAGANPILDFRSGKITVSSGTITVE